MRGKDGAYISNKKQVGGLSGWRMSRWSPTGPTTTTSAEQVISSSGRSLVLGTNSVFQHEIS